MKRALQRNEAGEAIIILVIPHACDWHPAPFGQLPTTPRDGKPVMLHLTSSGMSFVRSNREKLSQEGAAQLL